MLLRIQGVVIGLLIGAALFGWIISSHTGLRIGDVFELGKSLKESNRLFVAEYSLSEQNAATTLMLLENGGVEAARRRLWSLSRRVYWDTVHQKPQSGLEGDFGNRFVEFVRKSESLMEFVHAENAPSDGPE